MSTKVATRANKTTMAASHKPNLPHIEFADEAAERRWQEFGERNLSSAAHRIQDYARTLMILMQAYLADSDEENIPLAKNFALAEASTKGLTEMQVCIAYTLITYCWIHGKEFAASANNTTMDASHKPNLPHIEFADEAAKRHWQEFGERNLSSDAHRIQDYARTLMILMQAHLADSDEENIPVAKNFAFAHASTRDLTQYEFTIACKLIENCWIHGKEFAATLNA